MIKSSMTPPVWSFQRTLVRPLRGAFGVRAALAGWMSHPAKNRLARLQKEPFRLGTAALASLRAKLRTSRLQCGTTLWLTLSACIVTLLAAGGCVSGPASEAEVFDQIVQLTPGFDEAGRGVFSADGRWVMFQAKPAGVGDFQVFVARLLRDGDRVEGLGPAVRVSPAGSVNASGAFSPDGVSLLFFSTGASPTPSARAPASHAAQTAAGGDAAGAAFAGPGPTSASPGRSESASGSATPAAGGARRATRLFRADAWESAIAAAQPGEIIDLARNAVPLDLSQPANCSYARGALKGWVLVDGTSPRPALSNGGLARGGETPATGAAPAGGQLGSFAGIADEAAATPDGSNGGFTLHAVRPDGSGLTRLEPTADLPADADASPDGRRVAFRRAGQQGPELVIASISSGPPASASAGGRPGGGLPPTGLPGTRLAVAIVARPLLAGPIWHPDGRHLFFSASLHGSETELFLTRDDGEHVLRLTFTPGADVLPAMSSDGKYLMWTSTRGRGGRPQLFVGRFKMPQGS